MVTEYAGVFQHSGFTVRIHGQGQTAAGIYPRLVAHNLVRTFDRELIDVFVVLSDGGFQRMEDCRSTR